MIHNIKQYLNHDFKRHTQNVTDGLGPNERDLFKTFLEPNASTLEIGCSGGRISFGLEKEIGFKNIVGIDIIQEYIIFAQQYAKEIGSKIKFEMGDVTKMEYIEGSFKQAVCFGVVLSHIIDRENRISALEEIYRILKNDGIAICNARNYFQGGYFKAIKLIVSFLRLFYNPYKYKPQVLPRLGLGGRPDFLFFRPSKSQIYFYDPGEMIHDLLSVGFRLLFFRTTSQQQRNGTNLQGKYLKGGYGIEVVVEKKK